MYLTELLNKKVFDNNNENFGKVVADFETDLKMVVYKRNGIF